MSQSQRESIQHGKQQTVSELYMDKIILSNYYCPTSQIIVVKRNMKTDILIACS